MDYEEKYNDMIARLKSLAAVQPAVTKAAIESQFPEIVESEDERMIQYFKDLAPFDKAEELYEKYGFSHKDALAWLEKRVEQKPTEWSEEDEKTIVKMRDFFIRVLGDKPDFTEDKRYEEFIEFIDNRLKSLRPHSSYHEGFKKGFAKAKEMHYDHWKPSKEQMAALNNAILLNEDHYNGAVLSTLREQLKKLREE